MYAMPSEPPVAADTATDLAHELGRHARLLQMFRARMAAWAPAGLDGAAFGVLMSVVKCGPVRQGELADATMLDPSTVSRYVAQLVKAGLVIRRADPADGRAVQLVATADGTAIGAQVAERRQQLIADMLADWPDDDARMLVRLLRRLNDEMDARRDTPPLPPLTR